VDEVHDLFTVLAKDLCVMNKERWWFVGVDLTMNPTAGWHGMETLSLCFCVDGPQTKKSKVILVIPIQSNRFKRDRRPVISRHVRVTRMPLTKEE